MTADLTLFKLEGALRTIKSKKAPGPDGISGDMLKHLGVVAKKHFSSSTKAGRPVQCQTVGKWHTSSPY
jgi:hypothetical protein